MHLCIARHGVSTAETCHEMLRFPSAVVNHLGLRHGLRLAGHNHPSHMGSSHPKHFSNIERGVLQAGFVSSFQLAGAEFLGSKLLFFMSVATAKKAFSVATDMKKFPWSVTLVKPLVLQFPWCFTVPSRRVGGARPM